MLYYGEYNTFLGCNSANYGGVLYLNSYMSLYEEFYVVYGYNYAEYGGTVYCLNCDTVALESPLFEYNAAFQASSLFLDYDSNYKSDYTYIDVYIISFNITNLLSMLDGGFMYFNGKNVNVGLEIISNSILSVESNTYTGSLSKISNAYETTSKVSGGGFIIVECNNIPYLTV